MNWRFQSVGIFLQVGKNSNSKNSDWKHRLTFKGELYWSRATIHGDQTSEIRLAQRWRSDPSDLKRWLWASQGSNGPTSLLATAPSLFQKTEQLERSRTDFLKSILKSYWLQKFGLMKILSAWKMILQKIISKSKYLLSWNPSAAGHGKPWVLQSAPVIKQLSKQPVSPVHGSTVNVGNNSPLRRLSNILGMRRMMERSWVINHFNRSDKHLIWMSQSQLSAWILCLLHAVKLDAPHVGRIRLLAFGRLGLVVFPEKGEMIKSLKIQPEKFKLMKES